MSCYYYYFFFSKYYRILKTFFFEIIYICICIGSFWFRVFQTDFMSCNTICYLHESQNILSSISRSETPVPKMAKDNFSQTKIHTHFLHSLFVYVKYTICECMFVMLNHFMYSSAHIVLNYSHIYEMYISYLLFYLLKLNRLNESLLVLNLMIKLENAVLNGMNL